MVKVVSSSQSDGLSDTDDELKKLRGQLGKAVAGTRRKLEADKATKDKSQLLGCLTNTPKVNPIIINPKY